MSGNTCLSKGYPQSESNPQTEDSNSEAQQSMRARNYCAHHNTRDHWTLRCMNRCPDLVVCLEERPSVFKTRSKLGTHLSTQCSGDERQSRPCAAR
ncbi:hypothetical protein TNCV_3397151 [Trichonephila clavipes]|nr:hypothetical protein TNCV_3397151 [Trichonephila clavipes]